MLLAARVLGRSAPAGHRALATAGPTSSAAAKASSSFSIGGEAFEGRAAYLDGAATTPIDPRVLDSMLPFMTSLYGNAHSRTHMYGWESDAAVEAARESVAKLIGASAKEVVFTSGATESNNISIKGTARFYKGRKTHVITTQTEHKCVLDSCRALEQEGFSVSYLPVRKNGLVDLQELKDTIR
jgi:cysteine desulfurase